MVLVIPAKAFTLVKWAVLIQLTLSNTSSVEPPLLILISNSKQACKPDILLKMFVFSAHLVQLLFPLIIKRFPSSGLSGRSEIVQQLLQLTHLLWQLSVRHWLRLRQQPKVTLLQQNTSFLMIQALIRYFVFLETSLAWATSQLAPQHPQAIVVHLHAPYEPRKLLWLQYAVTQQLWTVLFLPMLLQTLLIIHLTLQIMSNGLRPTLPPVFH